MEPVVIEKTVYLSRPGGGKLKRIKVSIELPRLPSIYLQGEEIYWGLVEALAHLLACVECLGELDAAQVILSFRECIELAVVESIQVLEARLNRQGLH